jgi:hypothetical protein
VNYKERQKEYNKVYYQKNKERFKEYGRAYYLHNYKRRMNHFILSGIRLRAKAKGIPFDLDLEDINPPDTCPVFNIPLKRNVGKGPKFDSPSVDRIIPELGYVKGNIQIISQKANLMKQDATPEELIQFANWVLKEYGQCQEATS